jgi:D-glycerate 3-kinase
MAEPLPDWQLRFLEQHRLPESYLAAALKWFDPVVELVIEHQNSAGRPWLVALNGSQGSGKTTLCDYLRASLSARGLSCVALSLDDFYLPRARRQALAEQVHPLLATRGVPGTHDMTLMSETLDQLLAGEAAAIPRFDKAVDDRQPPAGWERVSPGVDVVLLEGWCLGVSSEPIEDLIEPVNELERTEDSDGSWRQCVNQVLGSSFPAIYQKVDEWIMLRAPGFECVYRWRLEQEHKLAASSDGSGIMSDAEVARFVQFYQRLTERCLQQLPRQVNHLFTLDEQREVVSYLAAPGRRL